MNVQGTPGATEAPLNKIVRVAAVVVNVPLHGVVAESAMLNPTGSWSLNPTPVSVVLVFELVMVNVSVEVLPTERNSTSTSTCARSRDRFANI